MRKKILTEEEKQLLRNTRDYMLRMAHAIDKIEKGMPTRTACREENISPSTLRKHLQRNWMHIYPDHYKYVGKNAPKPPIYPEERMYMDIFKVTISQMYEMPVPHDFGETLQELLLKRKPREQKIMDMHYYQGLTMQEIADKLSISKSRTSQIVNTVLNSMRTPENKYKLFYGNDAWKKRQLAQKAADYAIRTQQEHLTYEEAKQKMKEQTPLPVTTRIDGVLLPTNVINALLRIGIDDLNQLREYTYNDLRRIKGLGERGLKRLMPILQKHDILKHE